MAGMEQCRAELERLYNSPEYGQLSATLSNSNPRFRDLTDRHKLLAIYLLKSNDFAMPDMWRLFYRRRIPAIEEFLSPAWLPATSMILYPKWRELLGRLFAPYSTYYQIILGGAIGGGKTTCAQVAHLYNLLRVTSLIDPHAILGAAPNKGLILSLFTITLPKAKKALIEPFRDLMRECSAGFELVDDRKEWKAGFPSFAAGSHTPFYDNNDELAMPNSVSVMLGSRTSHALSFDMFGAMLDEAEFRQNGSALDAVDSAFEIYSNLRERIDSRFLDSHFKLAALVSSARYATGVIAQYTKSVPKDSPTTIVAGYPIWEIKSFKAYDAGHFWVMRGTSVNPSRILAVDEATACDAGTWTVPDGCDLLKVPVVYRDKFEFRIEEAIRNLGGMQTLGEDIPFPDTSKIEDPLLPGERHLIAQLGAGLPLISQLMDGLVGPDNRLIRYPNVPRYIHLDLATASAAGFAMVHKELDGERTCYVVDASCWITSPTKIDLYAIADLVIDLQQRCGVYIRICSADQFQSDAVRQRIEVNGAADEVKLVSVVKSTGPYGELSRIVASDLLKIGPCPNLRLQMAQVRLRPDKPTEKVRRGPAGNDQLDSVVGATNNALNDYNYPATVRYHAAPRQQVVEQAVQAAFAQGGLQAL